MKTKISIKIPDDYEFRMELAEIILNLLQNPLERNSYSIAFDFEGNAFRKISRTEAIRIKTGEKVSFSPDVLVFPDTSGKPMWQDAYGGRSR